MKKILWLVSMIIVLNIFLTAETIERILLEGNKKVSQDTILFYMKSREKGIYSTSLLREDFKALWNTGFFENITIEAEGTGEAKIVKIKVIENMLISSITYKTGKKIKESDIIEKLQETTSS